MSFPLRGRGLSGALALLLMLSPALSAQEAVSQRPIPPRPEDLGFDPLRFEVPLVEHYRHTLSNGAPVFVAEDHSLPLVEISLTFRTGSFLDPPAKTGLAAMTGTLVRSGGTRSSSAEAFDERAEFLAARIASYGADVRSGANMSCITPVLEECFQLFFEMVKSPGFDAARLEIEKGRALEGMKQRNDDAQAILDREWEWLLFGDYFTGRVSTRSELESISRQDLVDFHRRTWQPDRMIVAVSGDVDTEAVLARLEAQISDWAGGGAAPVWPPPAPRHDPEPGLYYVDKEIPQGKVYIGHTSFRVEDWGHPDLPALRVMNHILGGGGFSSRIVQRVRSDEGLAYRAGSIYREEPFWPGEFRILYQSKSATVGLAAKISLEQVRRIQDEPVTPEELSLAVSSLVDSFPRRFESARQIAGTYAFDELEGRDSRYWQQWRRRIEAVTAEEVQRVAREHLHPERMIFLVVGDWEQIAAGDGNPAASLEELAPGEPRRIPLRDPLTLQPLE